MKFALIALSALTLLSACGQSGSSGGGSSAPACGQAVLDSRNDLSYAAQRIQNHDYSQSAVQNMIDKCQDFHATIGSSTCKASSTSTGGTVDVNYGGAVQQLCDKLINEGAARASQELNDGTFQN